MAPPAPGTFSTTTEAFQALPSSSPMARARMSVLPPGVKGTIRRIGRFG
jgi:hypothetical protein